MSVRTYRYVGPAHILALINEAEPGVLVVSAGVIHTWLRHHEGAATFVVNTSGDMRIANRRSEHVVCAGGAPVLSAGEVTFVRTAVAGVIASEITNQSTGYCPEPESWPAVAAALDRAGIDHLNRFTSEFVFRQCPSCGQRNIVKDDWWECAVCAAQLPKRWNFG